MSDYIVLFIVTVIFSACISIAIFGTVNEVDEIEYKSDKNFIYSQIKRNIEEIDILRARVYDLEAKIKEMSVVDDGK